MSSLQKHVMGLLRDRVTKTMIKQRRCHPSTITHTVYQAASSIAETCGYESGEQLVNDFEKFMKEKHPSQKQILDDLSRLRRRNLLPVYKKIRDSVYLDDEQLLNIHVFTPEEFLDAQEFLRAQDIHILGMDTETDPFKKPNHIKFDLVQIAFGALGDETIVFLKNWRNDQIKRLFDTSFEIGTIFAVVGQNDASIISDKFTTTDIQGAKKDALTTMYFSCFGRYVDKGSTMAIWSWPYKFYTDHMIAYAAIDPVATLRIYKSLNHILF
uniref:3'-5' exonuclease domain-containing protein n=1 Tax=Panagrolaimus sp. ES5 TaxID=591445 RepID=A0AC34G141_9BILA